MHDDPRDITDYLIQENGLDGALNAAIERAMVAQHDRDNYALSVWREIKAIVRERLAAQAAEAEAEAALTRDRDRPYKDFS